jgi:hypothetical protein
MMELVGDPIASTTLWAEKEGRRPLTEPEEVLVLDALRSTDKTVSLLAAFLFNI